MKLQAGEPMTVNEVRLLENADESHSLRRRLNEGKKTKMAHRTNVFYAGLLSVGFSLGTLLAGMPAAQATVISGSSSAFGESVSLTLTPFIGPDVVITSGPLPTVSGNAPPPYNLTDSLLSASVGNVLTTGVLIVNASSNVDGLPGIRFAAADATVNDLSLSILTALAVSATTIQSTAEVSGDFGALVRTGTTTIEGISVNGSPVIDLTPAPNTVLLNALGITIILNEQTPSGNGIDNADLEVNALHISFVDVPAILGTTLGLLNGDIIISHSEAALIAEPNVVDVPEPGSLLLLAGGITLIFGLRRKRLV
jgi:hypothetical protein